MIPRLKPGIGWSEIDAILNLPRSDDIETFEHNFAELSGQKHAVAFSYGRTAIVAILKALDIRDAEIICPSYTCVVVPHAIVTSGNTPVFIDPDPEDFNLDLNLIDEAIGPKTKVIIATSLFGYPVNLDLLEQIHERYPQLIIIQDCAHSFFCEWSGKPVHRQGLCAFYGLNISKIVTSIFGGMVTTDDDAFARKLRLQRTQLLHPAGAFKSAKRTIYLMLVYLAFNRSVYGFVNYLERLGLLDKFVRYYDPGIIDMPADYLLQMTPVEARVGTAQCIKYPVIVEHRRKLAKIYHQGLAGMPDIKLPPWESGATFSHYVIRSRFAEQIKAELLLKGVQLGSIVDYYIPTMQAYQGSRCHGYGTGENLPSEVINLPVHLGVREQDARRIVQLLKQAV